VKVLPALSSRTTRWKSARLRGGVRLQLLSAPLQNGIRFFQHPLPATPSAALADAPAFTRRRNVGFTMFDGDDTDELAPAYTPAALGVRAFPHTGERPAAHLFGWSLTASFGSPYLTMPLAVHLSWACHPAWFLRPRDARSRGERLTAASSSGRWRNVVTAASDPTVTSRAGAARLLRTEPQVRLTNLPFISNHHHHHLISHVYLIHLPLLDP
jgi:hypothetical protein